MLGKKFETSTVEADALLPTKYGTFRIRAFIEETTKKEHALLTSKVKEKYHWLEFTLNV